jgi:hypothetical protein
MISLEEEIMMWAQSNGGLLTDQQPRESEYSKGFREGKWLAFREIRAIIFARESRIEESETTDGTGVPCN